MPALLLWLGPDVLPKGRRKGKEEEHKTSALDLLRMPRLRNTIIASSLVSIAWDLYQFYLPIYGHSIGLSASTIGLVISAFAVAVFAIRIALPALVRRWGEYEVLVYTIVLAALAFFLFPLFENPYLLAAVSFLLGLGVGCGQPISGTLIYSLAPPGRAAEGAGVRVMFNNVTHLTVPLLFGGIGTAFGFTPVFMACSALLFSGSYYSHWSNARLAARK